MKKLIICLSVIFFSGCAELNEVVKQLPDGTFNNLPNISTAQLSNDQIAAGLREALDQGIDRQVTKLTQKDGFFKNDLVKILCAAEDAVSESTPIFVDAVKGITFSDAKNILLGNDDAATQYLNGKTNSALYSKFSPVIKTSLSKVGADSVWASIISKYNAIPLTSKVNPDLTDYVSQQALSGVFTMISVEEANIRNQSSFRTTSLLKQVFALQD